MNKKTIALVSVAVNTALFLVWVSEWAIESLLPYGQPHNLAVKSIDAVATVLAFPVRLFAFFVYGDHGSWSLPVLILLLAMSCLMWGVIAERTVCGLASGTRLDQFRRTSLMQPTLDNVLTPYRTPMARAADGHRWGGRSR